MPKTTTARYYVLGIKGEKPWVLAPEGGTLAQAYRAVDWQDYNGHSPASDWAICTYDRTRGLFVAQTGETYAVTERGIYTEEAFARHQAFWAAT